MGPFMEWNCCFLVIGFQSRHSICLLRAAQDATDALQIRSIIVGTLPKAHEPFFLGAIAKAISTVLTYPMQLAQTMLRVQKQAEKSLQESANGNDEDEEGYQAAKSKKLATDATRTYKSTLDCLIQIYRRKGLQGWFAGMKTKLLQTVLTAALTFLTYEQIIKALVSVHRALLNNKGATRLNKVTPS